MQGLVLIKIIAAGLLGISIGFYAFTLRRKFYPEADVRSSS